MPEQTPKKKATDRPLHVKSVPRQLKADWKAACAKRDVPLRERVLQWMRKDIEDVLNAQPLAKCEADKQPARRRT